MKVTKTMKIIVIRVAKVHAEPYFVLSVLNMLTHSILSIFLSGRQDYYFHFTYEETEA